MVFQGDTTEVSKFVYPRGKEMLVHTIRKVSNVIVVVGVLVASLGISAAQVISAPSATTNTSVAIPGFDPTSLDTTVDPCKDFYKFACGKYATNHPIPADENSMGPGTILSNVNTQWLRAILEKASVGGASRSPDEQKIGDYYAACMNTSLIQQKGLAPLQPLLDEVDSLPNGIRGKLDLPPLIGRLQRMGVNVFFSYGEQQDFKDASKQIALVSQGGLGLPEKDYYLRAGAKDIELRQQYQAYIANMLTLAGTAPDAAKNDAAAVLAFETSLAKASLGVTEMRDPEKIYHLEPIAKFKASIAPVNFDQFLDGIHSPKITEINDTTPEFFPPLVQLVKSTDRETLKAYIRFHILSSDSNHLPKRFDDETFDFYGRKLSGQPEQTPQWKRCARSVDSSLGEALGKVYVQQYFSADSKAKMLVMVNEIETAMDSDIDGVTWMSPATKVKAKEKLKLVANKIGYPDRWRDYTALIVKPDDALGNAERALIFENDRELARIGKPVDHGEWDMTPPTVNAYYDPSMNDINFPAGILQPPYYDKNADDATNYGDIGGVIGHELTHGFDDEGKKFDGHGNLSDWWSAEDTKNFEARTSCIDKEYSGFTAVGEGADAIKVNGKLTLGENTADNGGLVLAYMAYLNHAKKHDVDLSAKKDGFTAPQRFYLGYAQGWCESSRPESVRNQVLSDPHSPDHIRVNGVIVNQPGFAAAFRCQKGSPMVPESSCRVW
jgi:putative endopeptidase